MFIKLLEKFIDIYAFKEEMRKIGVAFITAGVAGIFLTHLVSLALAGWLSFLGCIFLLVGLLKMKQKEEDL